MKKLSITLLFAVLLIITGTKVFAQSVDFSGKWKIDEKKSDFGHNGPMSAAPEMTIIDTEQTFTVERGWDEQPLSYDGKVFEKTVDIKARRTKMITKKSIKRAADGQSMILTQKQTNDSPEAIIIYNTIEIWSLSADKDELTIKITTGQKNDPKPDVMTHVYTRSK